MIFPFLFIRFTQLTFTFDNLDQRTIGIGNPGRSIQHGWLAEDADHPAAPLKHMRHGRGKLHQLLQQQHLIPVLMPELLLR